MKHILLILALVIVPLFIWFGTHDLADVLFWYCGVSVGHAYARYQRLNC